jgi:hypothetical protein
MTYEKPSLEVLGQAATVIQTVKQAPTPEPPRLDEPHIVTESD